ncbi:ATP-binding cassette domain-containing protein [Streptomyces flaveolus]|uniref:ATP-binding cassette domain-containing protein n=1 Tax=Streptomyces flaveolus TaxID=67297 RepID=UPI0034329ED6
MPDHAIEARHLARSFVAGEQKVEAVRGVEFAVRTGEIFGFLGPNGAGKTTTMRMLGTLLRPDSGSATVAGHDLLANPAAVRRDIGYVAQQGGADPSATVRQELVLQSRLNRLSKQEAAARAEELSRLFDLTELLDRPGATLSGGQRRRLEIALGLVHRPKLLFLDEPTAGLDPPSRALLWQQIRRLRDEAGLTLFLTTHYLDEADSLCDRVLILDKGRVVAEDTPESLKAKVAGDIVTVRVSGSAEEARAALAAQRGVHQLTLTGTTLRFSAAHDEAIIPKIVRALDAVGVDPTFVEVTRPTLDDVFMAVTGERPAESAEPDGPAADDHQPTARVASGAVPE